MNGDFTRLTFRPNRHFSSVRMQQGRVLLDADWNEQVDIEAHRDRTTTGDVVGRSGAPLHEEGFALRPQLGADDVWDIVVGAGRYYVDGILCENENDTFFTSQPDAPAQPGAPLPAQTGTYVAYLDVWQRHLTALDLPQLREEALGGPDTTTRTRTVWQVKLERVGGVNAQVACDDFAGSWTPGGTQSTGRLRARAEPAPVALDECLVPPGAGFRRLENQLYRVEIHEPSPAGGGAPTFKWSRENGSIVTRLDGLQVVARPGGGEDTVLTVSDAGRDPVLGFAPGQWVELLEERDALAGRPGLLVQLGVVEGSQLVVPAWPTGAPQPQGADLLTQFWTVRRWDSPNGVDPVQTGTPTEPRWLDLEDGVQVEFTADEYRTGDYWLIPARSLTGRIEWPLVGGGPAFQSRHGTEHHFGALGLLRLDGTGWTTLADCRPLFPPLTELVTLSYVGGGGQEAVPDPQSPGRLLPLAAPLQVRVANGQWPVAWATVVFRIVSPGPAGPVGGTLRAGSAAGAEVVVQTAADGVAGCSWALDEDARHQSQQVVARLLENGDERSEVRFAAQQGRAAAVAYTPGAGITLADVDTVQEALDRLFLTGVGREPAIHVARVALRTGAELPNDSDVGAAALAEGILVACTFDDGAGSGLNPASVNRATCYVTIEVPYPINTQDIDLWGVGRPFAFQPIVLEAGVTAEIVGSGRTTANAIAWQPSGPTADWLRNQLFRVLSGSRFGVSRVLARLTLKGNYIGALDAPALLDGDTFGAPGTERTGVLLPSGDGRRGGDFELWFWLIAVAALSDLRINTAVVVGGARPRVTVVLSGPAPAQGTQVQIFVEGDNPNNAVSVPPSVRVDPGTREATFEVGTLPVLQAVNVSIRVVVGSESRAVSLSVQPTVADRLTLAPASVTSGGESQARVFLTGAAPAGGLSVRVASSIGNAVSFPDLPNAVVLVPAGASEIAFRVVASPTVGNVQTTISATPAAPGRPAQAALTIQRLTLTGPTFNPTQVIGGAASTGTVTLNGNAPAGGAVVDLATTARIRFTDLQGNTVSALTVPAGTTVGTFRAVPEGVLATTQAQITSTLRVGGASSTGTLTVLPTRVSNLGLSATTVVGGGSVTGTVTLDGLAPREGAVVGLGANSGLVGFRNVQGQAIGAVVVPNGGTSAQFQVTTQPLDFGEVVVVRITVAIGGASPSSDFADLTMRGPTKSIPKDNKDNRDDIGKLIPKEIENKAIRENDFIAVERFANPVVANREAPSPAEAPQGRAFITAESRPEVGETVLEEPRPAPPPAEGAGGAGRRRRREASAPVTPPATPATPRRRRARRAPPATGGRGAEGPAAPAAPADASEAATPPEERPRRARRRRQQPG